MTPFIVLGRVKNILVLITLYILIRSWLPLFPETISMLIDALIIAYLSGLTTSIILLPRLLVKDESWIDEFRTQIVKVGKIISYMPIGFVIVYIYLCLNQKFRSKSS